MTLDEVNQELKELTKDDINKSNRIYKLKNLQAELIHEKCKSDIGRCFKTQNNQYYIKIVDAPKIEKQFRGADEINEYQYPALYINTQNKIEPFDFSNVFSGNWGKGNMVQNGYIEISKEEFNDMFKQICENWQVEIIGI
jgi:hypothetical protein